MRMAFSKVEVRRVPTQAWPDDTKLRKLRKPTTLPKLRNLMCQGSAFAGHS